MIEFLDKIYYKLFPGSVYEQEERYIKENGYPKKSQKKVIGMVHMHT